MDGIYNCDNYISLISTLSVTDHYHNLVAWMIEYQVPFNTIDFLLEYGQSDCGVSTWSCPSIFMNVAMWEHRTLHCEVLKRCQNLLL
jgi:hypothetical protein